MAQGKGLGRGLGALLGDAALDTREGGSVMLRVADIEPNASQPRKDFDEEALADLAESIKGHGLIQPIAVRRQSSGLYQIIAGERRWRASRIAGLKEIPAVVFDASDARAQELALVENLQREDLNPIEEALGLKSLIEDHNLTQEEAAARVGKSRPTVANSLRLLQLSEPVRDMLAKGALTVGHARALLQLDDRLQAETAGRIIREGLSVRQTETLVRKLGQERDQKDSGQNDTGLTVNYLEELSREMTQEWGRRIRIVNGRQKGKLEIEYYGEKDLQELVERLTRLR